MEYIRHCLLFMAFVALSNCSDTPTDLHTHIRGFWKVHQVQNNGETNDMYVEISDSVLLYWYQDVNYIFPFQYRIENSETLIVWLKNDPESRPTPIGRLTVTGKNSFVLTNEHQRLDYQRATFEDFLQETGKKWQALE